MEGADKKLIIKYLYNHDECTPEEDRRVQELLQLPWAQELVRELSFKEWDEPVKSDDRIGALHKSWKEKANAHILSGKNIGLKKNTPIKRLTYLRYAAVWAGVILVTGLAVWQWQKKAQEANYAMVEKTNTQGMPVRYILPDRSEVFLAGGSKISYPADFSAKTRNVQLQGEAFFQVTHNKEKPFIIRTGEIQTQVLGTSFKVTAINGRPLEVAVATGKVSVSRKKDEQGKLLATLTPGNKVTWYQAAEKAELGQADIDGLEHWKSGDMVFDRLNMEYIVAELQRRYGVSILFADEEIKANTVTATFSATKPVAKVMNTLEIAGKFRYETKDNKTFTIYKTE